MSLTNHAPVFLNTDRGIAIADFTNTAFIIRASAELERQSASELKPTELERRIDASMNVSNVQPKGPFSYIPRVSVGERIVIVQGHIRATPAPDSHPSPAADRVDAEMADLCRQDRAKLVAGCGPQPRASRISTCSVMVGRPQAASPSRGSPEPYPVRAGSDYSEARNADERRAAASRRHIADEEETRAAIGRFRPFLRVASVSISPPRVRGPDPYGFGEQREHPRRF